MTILVGDWVEPVVEQEVSVEIYSDFKIPCTRYLKVYPGEVFKVDGILRTFRLARIIPLEQCLETYNRDELFEYSVDLNLLRKIEGERLKMLQTLYNDSKKLSSGRDS